MRLDSVLGTSQKLWQGTRGQGLYLLRMELGNGAREVTCLLLSSPKEEQETEFLCCRQDRSHHDFYGLGAAHKRPGPAGREGFEPQLCCLPIISIFTEQEGPLPDTCMLDAPPSLRLHLDPWWNQGSLDVAVIRINICVSPSELPLSPIYELGCVPSIVHV